jgi:hypothetical protein|uniref:ParB-like N-terminal domain-containing protein n=1 Tax=Siphoviridae sp. ctAjZ17 TaxID=2827797 RepID=A0A8S5SPE7_9CAUD|nr:MAG TPA: hypothetical protein [Siphoviridae sp. ctAjZ17]
MGREKFSALDMLSKRSLPERKEKQAIIYKDPRELVPTQENFYTTKNISKLKASIKITGYLMQPILIENVDGEDKVLAGHRRRLCCIELIEEGDTRFEKVPCMYAAEINVSEDKELTPEQREAITPFLRQFKVIQANNYRDKNDWERMQEALEMEKIVKNLKEKVGITGTVRENLKDLLGVSNAQFGRYKNISNHLIQELMEEFQDGGINISVADAAASLKPELQQQAYEMFMKNKVLSLPDIQLLKDRQELDIPGQMTIEQATRQQKPQEDETPIPVELQIERFFDSLKKNTTARIRNGDKLIGTKMISMLYCYVKHRNGYLNYQGHPDRITFNPDSPEEKEMTWQELTEELIRRYSTKKPVKMTTIDAPEKPEKKETNAGKCIHREGFTCTLEAAQKAIAGDGENCNRKCCWNCEKHGACGYECNASAHRPAENIPKKSCQSATETPDEQQEDHFVNLNKMVKHPRNTDKIPTAWPEELKDIPIPSTGDLSIYLQKQEDLLKQMTEVEKEEAGFPELVIKKQQMLVAGLRILKNIVEDCQEELEQPGLPIMKNNDQRKEWLRNYKSWGLWYEDKNVGIKYYKYDFANGARLIVEEFAPDPSEKSQWYTPGEHHYMHLVGGPKPECKNDKGWSYHSRYNKYQNSETELVEFLKEIQK